MPAFSTEQRDFRRFNADLPIWFRPAEQQGQFKLVETTNVSAGGLLLTLSQAPAQNDRLEVRFQLPHIADLIKAEATVRHVTPVGEDRFRVGIQFVKVANQSIPDLMAHLEKVFQ